jgi:hypothetical protein
MSLLATNCHGYVATGVTGWPATPSRVWIVGWLKVDSTTGGTRRALAQVTAATLDSTRDYFGAHINGANVLMAESRTGNVNTSTPDPGNFYFWNGAQQNKWTVAATVLDLDAASSQDLKMRFGRTDVDSGVSRVQNNSSDLAAFSDTLTTIYIASDLRKVKDGSGTSNDSSDGMKVAYIAIGHGSAPSAADITACIAGQHPADLAGAWEYWDLTDSGAGLVGALRGITLAPFGGSATTTFDGADNPTVDPPTAPAAPVLTSPSAGTPGTTSITIQATSDRPSDGTMRFLRRVGGSQASDTTIASTGESQAATANPQSRLMTGFTASSTNNFVDMVQVGAGGNSNVVSVGPFTMASAAAFAAGAALARTNASGTMQAIASAFAAGAALARTNAGGTLGPVPGVITSQPLRTNNGTLLASVALDYVDVYLEASGAFVGRFTGLSTNGSGVFTVTSPLITPGTAYKLDWRATGGQRRMPVATAA